MNSAARFLNESPISRAWVVSIILTRVQYGFFILLVGFLTSALSVVYVTNVTRSLNASLQQSKMEKDRLQIEQSQLILEKHTWMTQARVQDVATNKLEMVVPASRSVVIIKE